MPEDPLQEPVASLVDRLARAGLEPHAERGSGMVNHLIECRSPAFAVRLVGDRGQWWAEGGLPGGSEWYDADIWASCLTSSPPAGLPPLEEQVDFFASHQEALALAAAQESTWGCLRRNRERRTRERLGLPPADE